MYSWGESNKNGELGRDTSKISSKKPGLVPLPVKAAQTYVSNGSRRNGGHSAIIDENGQLWMSGCDLWLQLGFNRAETRTGYTWKDGKLSHDRFVQSTPINQLLKLDDEKANNNFQRFSMEGLRIRDVSLGGNHTLVLASDRRSVYAFGKGGDGQLGLVRVPVISAPVRSKLLSDDNNVEERDGKDEIMKERSQIHAVCAVSSCSATIGENGRIKKYVGKCDSKIVTEGLAKCIAQARHKGLID